MGNNASRSQTPDPEQQPPCWEDSFPSQTSRSTYYNIPYQLQSEEYSFHAQTLSTYHALFGPSQQSHSYKRAVLCGLLHKGTKHELDGCINDVKIMKYILVVRFKFPESSIITLTDDETDPSKRPTKSNIFKALNWLVQGCRPEDSLVFFFAGHGFREGGQLKLIPLDHDESEPIKIVDDELYEKIIRPLPQGAKLHVIIDACKSGNALGLPFRYTSTDREEGGDLVDQYALGLPFRYRTYREGRGDWEYQCSDDELGILSNGTNGGTVICFTSCDDHQLAYEISVTVEDIWKDIWVTAQDTWEDIWFLAKDIRAISRAVKTGTLTFALTKAILPHRHSITYGELLKAIIYTVTEKNGLGLEQLPQLTSNETFDVDTNDFFL